jgi:hypothetical protein
VTANLPHCNPMATLHLSVRQRWRLVYDGQRARDFKIDYVPVIGVSNMNHRYYRSCLQPTPSFRCRCKCAASRRGLAALNETIRQSSRSAGASAFWRPSGQPAVKKLVPANDSSWLWIQPVGEQSNGKLAAMLGLLSKLIRQSGRLRANDPQRALCHPTILREASSSGAQISNDTR